MLGITFMMVNEYKSNESKPKGTPELKVEKNNTGFLFTK